MTPLPETLVGRIEQSRKQGRERRLSLPSGEDFCSNDYLGFAIDARLRERVLSAVRDLPIGASASRLLRGHSSRIQRLEEKLAAFCGTESALLFPSGYQANIGLFSALPGPGDLVYSDEKNHASIIDGIRLSRASRRIYPHRDTRALRALLERDRIETAGATRWIATESVFSMEGHVAPLQEIARLADEFNAFLIVDEAHATGILGSGLARSLGLASPFLATIHTGGKALGASGAWIAGSDRLRHALLQLSRAQIFSTAPSPWLVAALDCAIDYWEEVGRERAHEVLRRARDWTGCADYPSPIVPIPIGTSEDAVRVAEDLRALGFDLRAIRPPTVPEGGARLRLVLHWQNPESETKRLREALTAMGWVGQ